MDQNFGLKTNINLKCYCRSSEAKAKPVHLLMRSTRLTLLNAEKLGVKYCWLLILATRHGWTSNLKIVEHVGPLKQWLNSDHHWPVSRAVPKSEIEGEMGSSYCWCSSSCLLSQAMRKLTGSIKGNANCLVTSIQPNSYENWCHVWFHRNHKPVVNALKFLFLLFVLEYSSYRNRFKQGEEVIGKTKPCESGEKQKLPPPI